MRRGASTGDGCLVPDRGAQLGKEQASTVCRGVRLSTKYRQDLDVRGLVHSLVLHSLLSSEPLCIASLCAYVTPIRPSYMHTYRHTYIHTHIIPPPSTASYPLTHPYARLAPRPTIALPRRLRHACFLLLLLLRRAIRNDRQLDGTTASSLGLASVALHYTASRIAAPQPRLGHHSPKTGGVSATLSRASPPSSGPSTSLWRRTKDVRP